MWIEQVIKIKRAIIKIKDEDNEENKFALKNSVSIHFYCLAVFGIASYLSEICCEFGRIYASNYEKVYRISDESLVIKW